MGLTLCKKCKKHKNVDEFSEFIAVTKEGKIKKRRTVCYGCNYGNRYHFWEQATEKEIFAKMKKRLAELVIKKKGCWDWKGFIRPDGYTRMKFNGKDIGGHVFSWMLSNKCLDIPNLNILHKCDNRRCANPNHLFLGTYRDNMIDMVLKKRHPNIKLTVENVKEIKQKLIDGVTITRLAKDFEVNFATIFDIKHCRTWKHVKI